MLGQTAGYEVKSSRGEKRGWGDVLMDAGATSYAASGYMRVSNERGYGDVLVSSRVRRWRTRLAVYGVSRRHVGREEREAHLCRDDQHPLVLSPSESKPTERD